MGKEVEEDMIFRGGKAEEGECPVECLLREVEEETVMTSRTRKEVQRQATFPFFFICELLRYASMYHPL